MVAISSASYCMSRDGVSFVTPRALVLANSAAGVATAVGEAKAFVTVAPIDLCAPSVLSLITDLPEGVGKQSLLSLSAFAVAGFAVADSVMPVRREACRSVCFAVAVAAFATLDAFVWSAGCTLRCGDRDNADGRRAGDRSCGGIGGKGGGGPRCAALDREVLLG